MKNQSKLEDGTPIESIEAQDVSQLLLNQASIEITTVEAQPFNPIANLKPVAATGHSLQKRNFS